MDSWELGRRVRLVASRLLASGIWACALRASCFYCLKSVTDQVEKDPFQGDNVAADLRQTRVEHLPDHDPAGSLRIEPSHPERLMQNLMDIDRFTLETFRAAGRKHKHLLDQ